MGDVSGFDEFVDEHGTRLLRYAYLLTHDRYAAEDLVQESLLHVHQAWTKKPPEHPGAYVRRAILNAYLGEKRRRAAAPPIERDDSRGGPSLEDRAADRDLWWRLLGDLPPRQRAALVLRYYEDLPDQQIAFLLKCRQATVRSLIARGLTAIRTSSSSADLVTTLGEEHP